MRLTAAQTEELEAATCTRCGTQDSLKVEYRLEAQPVGSFSLSGNQMKFSAIEWPWLVCTSCDAECKGKLITGNEPDGEQHQRAVLSSAPEESRHHHVGDGCYEQWRVHVNRLSRTPGRPAAVMGGNEAKQRGGNPWTGGPQHQHDDRPAMGVNDVLLETLSRVLAELSRRETEEVVHRHVIRFSERGWTIRHPLACRPGLFECPVNQAAED